MTTKRNIITTILAAALLVSMTGLAFAECDDKLNCTAWDLDDDNVMYTVSGYSDHIENGSVILGGGDSQIWTADQIAQCDVYFESEIWQGRLTTGVSLAGMYTVDIGYSDADGSNFVSNGNTGNQIAYYGSQGASQFGIDANNFTVLSGKYLALNVTNIGSSQFTVTTDGSSYVVYPPDIDYPVPELPAFALAGIGAVVGLLALGRRKD